MARSAAFGFRECRQLPEGAQGSEDIQSWRRSRSLQPAEPVAEVPNLDASVAGPMADMAPCGCGESAGRRDGQERRSACKYPAYIPPMHRGLASDEVFIEVNLDALGECRMEVGYELLQLSSARKVRERRHVVDGIGHHQLVYSAQVSRRPSLDEPAESVDTLFGRHVVASLRL